MSVKVDIKRAQDIMELFDATPRQAQIVMWRAITRAATAGRTRASMNVRKNYMVSANDVKKQSKYQKRVQLLYLQIFDLLVVLFHLLILIRHHKSHHLLLSVLAFPRLVVRKI